MSPPIGLGLGLSNALLGGARVQLPASLVVLAHGESAADQTAYTFAAQPLGTETSDRIIVATFSTRNTGVFPPTCTIAGVAATRLYTETAGSPQGNAMFAAAIPTGTSGDIIVTWAGATLRCGMGLWALYNALSMTPSDIKNGTSQASNVSLTVPNNGCALGYGMSNAGGAQTWTGLTKLFDVALETTLTHSGAQAQFSTGGAQSLTDSFATGGAGYNVLFASWAPK